MKITMYELLGMIKDGKAPEKIKYMGYIFEYDINHKRYESYFDEQIWTLNDFVNVDDNLNDEVEILEEEKKIPEKLKIEQEENERLKDEKPEYILRWKLEEQLEDYKSRNKKTIEDIDLVIELIKQQPTEDDSWILNKLNGFKYLLNGGDE